MSISDDLSKLAELKNSGVITQEEFNIQKYRLLNGNNSDGEAAVIPVSKKPRIMLGCLIAFAIFVTVLLFGTIFSGSTANQDTNSSSTAASNEADASADADDRKPNAPEVGVTMENYRRVHTGMRFKAVVAILGPPSEEISRSEFAGTETVMYSWTGGFLGNMNAMFQNGRLVTKAQFGLR